jgi:hypothetical protein
MRLGGRESGREEKWKTGMSGIKQRLKPELESIHRSAFHVGIGERAKILCVRYYYLFMLLKRKSLFLKTRAHLKSTLYTFSAQNSTPFPLNSKASICSSSPSYQTPLKITAPQNLIIKECKCYALCYARGV